MADVSVAESILLLSKVSGKLADRLKALELDKGLKKTAEPSIGDNKTPEKVIKPVIIEKLDKQAVDDLTAPSNKILEQLTKTLGGSVNGYAKLKKLPVNSQFEKITQPIGKVDKPSIKTKTSNDNVNNQNKVFSNIVKQPDKPIGIDEYKKQTQIVEDIQQVEVEKFGKPALRQLKRLLSKVGIIQHVVVDEFGKKALKQLKRLTGSKDEGIFKKIVDKLVPAGVATVLLKKVSDVFKKIPTKPGDVAEEFGKVLNKLRPLLDKFTKFLAPAFALLDKFTKFLGPALGALVVGGYVYDINSIEKQADITKDEKQKQKNVVGGKVIGGLIGAEIAGFIGLAVATALTGGLAIPIAAGIAAAIAGGIYGSSVGEDIVNSSVNKDTPTLSDLEFPTNNTGTPPKSNATPFYTLPDDFDTNPKYDPGMTRDKSNNLKVDQPPLPVSPPNAQIDNNTKNVLKNYNLLQESNNNFKKYAQRSHDLLNEQLTLLSTNNKILNAVADRLKGDTNIMSSSSNIVNNFGSTSGLRELQGAPA